MGRSLSRGADLSPQQVPPAWRGIHRGTRDRKQNDACGVSGQRMNELLGRCRTRHHVGTESTGWWRLKNGVCLRSAAD